MLKLSATTGPECMASSQAPALNSGHAPLRITPQNLDGFGSIHQSHSSMPTALTSYDCFTGLLLTDTTVFENLC